MTDPVTTYARRGGTMTLAEAIAELQSNLAEWEPYQEGGTDGSLYLDGVNKEALEVVLRELERRGLLEK